MKNDIVLTSLLAIAMVMALVIVCINVLAAPGYGAPEYTSRTSSAVSSAEASAAKASFSENGEVFPLDINKATAAELQMIPDIGPVTAQKIVDYRASVGTILSVDELLKVDGIGEKTVEQLRKYCVVE